MAAKPPKPPGNFLKHPANNSSNKNNNNINININNNEHINESNSSENLTTISTCVKANDDNCGNSSSSSSSNSSHTAPTKKANCNCTNITIMHLFHEMKQEFPTIPDTIVTQCVNENCHQRDNCIQMLRNELELNPIPVQSYPAKVLHPSTHNNNNHQHSSNSNSNSNSSSSNNNNQHQHQHQTGAATVTTTTSPSKPPLQQKPALVQQKPPLKPPLKPVRPAPLHPPTIPSASNNSTTAINKIQSNSPLLQRKISSSENRIHSPVRHASNVLSGDDVVERLVDGGDINEKLNDMPAKTTPSIQQTQPANPPSPHVAVELNNKNNNYSEHCNSVGESAIERQQPRARPTTLNLNTQQQQQQRQRLNVQLQEHFLQQRNKQQQPQPSAPPPAAPSQPQPATANANVTTTKPLRKAPLPPIAPKPILFNHSNTSNNNNNNNNNGDSLSSHTASPLSESEISVNVSLSTPSPTSSSKTHHSPHLLNKSPIRHRSVITLQPEPPYTRDFFQTTSPTPAALTPTTSTTANSSAVSSPTNSGYSGSSQKSYTSVNLTLRPPTTVLNSALQPSTIDITAGPGFSGASGGGKSLSYSSTSYDARLGYQQNFHITVTDEGGVFSASRRRPQRNINQVNICENQYDGNSDGDKNNHVNSLYAEQQQHLNQHQQQQQYLQQFHNNTNVVAALQQQQNSPINTHSPQGIGGGIGFGNMCLAPQQADDEYVTETLERQKKRRDKLAAALRENKKRLSQVEHEVNLITGPIPMGLAERLDIEIQKLRAECQAMLRSSNPLTQQQRPAQQQPQQQFPPQPFPRQRSARPPPRPPPPGQTSLDIIQHHATPTTPHTPASLPNFINTPSPTMVAHQQQQLQHSHSLSPSIYQQQQQAPPPYQQPHNHPTATAATSAAVLPDDETYYSDPDTGVYDDDDDDEYEVVEPWECNMCTFRNHPQLNICECCENVRILPEPVLSREDIHITLSPGENRIIHSWIVS